MTTRGKRSRNVTAWWRLGVAAALVIGGVAPAAASHGAPGDPEFLTVAKSVDDTTPEPGQPFTYTIAVTCAEDSCLDAQLVDALPAELDGYDVLDVTMTPSVAEAPREVTWTEAGATISEPSQVGPETALIVDFTGAVTAPDGTGLQFGTTFNVLLTLGVPADLAPGSYHIVNTAETTATNSAPDSSAATIDVEVPVEIGVSTTKSWSPTPQSFDPGRASTIGLGVTNDSNIGVDTLVIQEPATAPDGVTTLDPSNPFTITDFTGFGTLTPPAGATTILVDAYVFDGSTWGWTAGAPVALPGAPQLPIGVGAADVGGLRISFGSTDPDPIAIGATGSVQLDLAQRATDRAGADLSLASHQVDNVTLATAAADGFDPATATATAAYRVNPATLGVDAAKDIVPARISAGDVATGTISARNTSDVGVAELRLADLGYFTDEITFGGFTEAPEWPVAATTGEVVYHFLAGGTPPSETVTFPNGAVPDAPSAPISGFEIVYTAPDGGITADAATDATFEIVTTEAATGAAVEVTTTNTVATTVTAPNGRNAVDEASDTLTIVTPGLDITLDKQILPQTPVAAGETVVTSLSTNLTTTSDYVTADQIVIEDAWDGTSSAFWDAFDLAEIASTQVPSDTTLTVEVQTTVGTWVTLATVPATGSPAIFSMTSAEIDTALGAVDRRDVTGIRFTLDKPTGFASDTTVTPYVVSSARSTLRSGGATTTEPATPVIYENAATADGSGTTPVSTELTDQATDTGQAQIISFEGAGPIGIDKEWNRSTVDAQSNQQRSTALQWRVSPGYQTVTITDPITPTPVADTVFDAFDLLSIRPITASSTPYTNGWFLRYDTITSIELHRSGSWTTVPTPAGGWINASGAFVGYTLSAAEIADTTGVRVTLTENTTAREAAQQAGPSYDPYAPLPNTGVAASSAAREFDLRWRIRSAARSDGRWVTADETYNTADPAIVDNTAELAADDGTTTVTDTADDTIRVLDPGPGVLVDKQVVAPAPTPVPYPGTPADEFPTATYTIEARNDSVAAASYVRVTDPPSCTDADPITACAGSPSAVGATADPFTAPIDWLNPIDSSANPFERYDATGIDIAASIPSEVDLDATTVWLLRYDDTSDTYSTEQTTATAVNALDVAALADVVGVSVTFQDTDPATDGGSITPANRLTIAVEMRLRTHLRSSGAVQELGAGQTVDVTNRVVAQSYDPIVAPGVIAADLDDVDIVLTGGVIDVSPTKSVAPATITEPERTRPVTVTLGANQGTAPRSTLSPAEVWIRDDATSSPEFWRRFDLTALGPITAPSGADRVTVAVYGPYGPGDSMVWVDDGPVPIASVALPGAAASDPSTIEGIEFTFTRDDGAFFSPILPAPNWNASAAFSAALRDTYRDSGEPIDFTEQVEVDNTVTVRSDRLNGEASDEKTTDASIQLDPGTRELSVRKLTNNGNRFASAGSLVPFDLTFENTGTGYLTIEELRDTLPTELVYLGDPAPVTTADPSGSLSDDVTVVTDGSDVVFTWPADGRTMQPGETFGIRLWLELQPVGAGTRVVNEMTVHTTETLGACSHLTGGETTDAWDDDPTTCGTTDYVSPAVGANLFTVKGVRGAVDGASVPTDPSATCEPTLTTSTGSYFRAPCAANSVIGGTDDWVLRVVNAGTVAVADMTVFDQLPVAGDRFLVSGSSRGSDYRPRLTAEPAIDAPAGTTWQIEVATTTGVCSGTWSGLTTNPPCEQNGEDWTPADAATDWPQVTGLRIVFDFSELPGGALQSGQTVDIAYSSENVVATDDDPSGRRGPSRRPTSTRGTSSASSTATRGARPSARSPRTRSASTS
ncbi:MAG: hypothetical protein R2697_13525 [Ilumatobacteraceae bacterium]